MQHGELYTCTGGGSGGSPLRPSPSTLIHPESPGSLGYLSAEYSVTAIKIYPSLTHHSHSAHICYGGEYRQIPYEYVGPCTSNQRMVRRHQWPWLGSHKPPPATGPSALPPATPPPLRTIRRLRCALVHLDRLNVLVRLAPERQISTPLTQLPARQVRPHPCDFYL